jgi:hypothetical protein
MVFKNVCPLSTTKSRKENHVVPMATVRAVHVDCMRSEEAAKGRSRLRVAKHAAALGKVASLVDHDPNVDGSS